MSPMMMTMLLCCFIPTYALGTNKFHFVLVHGAGHGAWCWYKVASKLKQEGHIVDAVDLVSAGIDNQDANTVGTLENYTEPLTKLLQSLPKKRKVVLVGHSLGGFSLTYVLEKMPRKILAAVYVTALMTSSGPSGSAPYFSLLRNPPEGLVVVNMNGKPTSLFFELDHVQSLLYNESPLKDVELAKALLKPAPVFDPTMNLTRERYGSVPRYYIKSLKDNGVTPSQQEMYIKMTPPKQVFEIDTDHCPFFSEPGTLVSYLTQISAQESSS